MAVQRPYGITVPCLVSGGRSTDAKDLYCEGRGLVMVLGNLNQSAPPDSSLVGLPGTLVITGPAGV